MALELSTLETERALQNAIDKAWIPHFRSLGMEASGEWARNVHSRGSSIWGLDYTTVLGHKGRGRNHNQDPEEIAKFTRWAGSTFIKKWVQDKGLNINPYAVAYTIARKGTTWHRNKSSDLLEFLKSDNFLEILREELKNLLVLKVHENIIVELRRLKFK